MSELITTIRFEDQGQDFAEWDIQNEIVVNCRPFQASHWMGRVVVNEPYLKPGDCVMINGGLTIKYPIVEVKRDQPVENKIDMELLSKEARNLICTSVDDVKSSLRCNYTTAKGEQYLREVLAYLANHNEQKTKLRMVRSHLLRITKQK